MNFTKNLALWVVIAIILVALYNLFGGIAGGGSQGDQPYSEFRKAVDDGRVNEVTIDGDSVTWKDQAGNEFTTTKPTDDPTLVQNLRDHSVRIKVIAEHTENPILYALINWFPMLLLIGVWIFFMRQMQSGGGKAMGFGKSRARLLTEKTGRVTFEDVAGIDEAKQELQEIVEFLKDPQKFQRLGGKIPKGVLLVGPPGTGKTLLARAIAGEANVPFFTISGSDFVEMFVGVGASRVRDMFEQGKKNAPCIIFIDEIDAVGRHRGAGLGGGNDEREQTLNQLLVEMDGFEANEGVILIAATNRPDVLDPALLRPGRFDRQVVVPNPDIVGREKILKVHMRKVPLAPDVDARDHRARHARLLRRRPRQPRQRGGAAGRPRRHARVVTMAEFEDAKDKVMMGPERRSMVMTEEEKKLTAYHEAGHALVMLNVPRARSAAQGHDHPARPRARRHHVAARARPLQRLQDRDGVAQLASMFGGRIAEELIFGKENVTTRRLERHPAGDQPGARAWSPNWACREKLGPLRYASNEEEVFLGHSVTQRRTCPTSHGEDDRRGNSPHDRRSAKARRAGSSPSTSTISIRSPRPCSSTRRCRAKR